MWVCGEYNCALTVFIEKIIPAHALNGCENYSSQFVFLYLPSSPSSPFVLHSTSRVFILCIFIHSCMHHKKSQATLNRSYACSNIERLTCSNVIEYFVQIACGRISIFFHLAFPFWYIDWAVISTKVAIDTKQCPSHLQLEIFVWKQCQTNRGSIISYSMFWGSNNNRTLQTRTVCSTVHGNLLLF